MQKLQWSYLSSKSLNPKALRLLVFHHHPILWLNRFCCPFPFSEPAPRSASCWPLPRSWQAQRFRWQQRSSSEVKDCGLTRGVPPPPAPPASSSSSSSSHLFVCQHEWPRNHWIRCMLMFAASRRASRILPIQLGQIPHHPGNSWKCWEIRWNSLSQNWRVLSLGNSWGCCCG